MQSTLKHSVASIRIALHVCVPGGGFVLERPTVEARTFPLPLFGTLGDSPKGYLSWIIILCIYTGPFVCTNQSA